MPSMGGAAGAGGSGNTGSTASVYTPANQPGADQSWWSTLSPLIGQAANGGAGTPGGWAYPQAQSFFNQYLNPQGGASGTTTVMTDSANRASNYGIDTLFPQGTAGASSINDASNLGLSYAPQVLNNAFNPAYGNVTAAVGSNPFYAGAMGGALQGAAEGQAGAQRLQTAGNSILNAGFDPQSALFNRTQQQLLDQSNAVNAMSGVGGTPYGASTTANALGNFDMNWQNNLLNRETTAAGAASPLFQAAPQLAASSGQMPSAAFLGQQQADLSALNAQNNAGIAGGQGYNSMLGGALSGLSGAQGLGSTAANNLLSLGAAPYNAGGNIANNAMSGLTNTTNLGNQQYTLPNDVLGALQSYMQLGQNASQISGNLGNMGFNQLATGLGGGLSAANSLFGGGSSGGLLSGLFGGGSSGALTGAASQAGFDTLGSTVGMGAADVAGGGDSLLSALPFAAGS